MENCAWGGVLASIDLAGEASSRRSCGIRKVPFLSSTVTVSFWHFMRNLDGWKGLGQLVCWGCLREEREKFFSLVVRDEEDMCTFEGKQEIRRESLPDELHGEWVSCESGLVIVMVLYGRAFGLSVVHPVVAA